MKDSKDSWHGQTVTHVYGKEPSANPSATVDETGHSIPKRLGRYEILRKIGQGAMGVVYAAFDRELERKVAIKLLTPNASPSDSSDTTSGSRARLRREAQALAKLSHPNVVAVYDVGMVTQDDGDHIFIAMELIDGITLTEWLAEAKRPWRETLQMMRQAGQGLAAAHRAGLVHRDFKPDNVLVSHDQVPHVVDFGLARTLAPNEPSISVPGPDLAEIEADVTEPGVLMGSPAYMAPERFSGTNDERCDQFSFCVAVHEALYGERPFADGNVFEIVEARRNGKVQSPAKDHGVPAWVRQVILRGLAPRAEDRWNSMEDLLAALGRDTGAGRRRLWVMAAILVAVLVGWFAATWQTSHTPHGICGDHEARWDGIWDDSRRSELQEVFKQADSEGAGDMFRLVSGLLDTHVRSWEDARVQVCEAQQDGDVGEAAFLHHMACFAERQEELDSMVDFLSKADLSVLIRATTTVRSLESPRRCVRPQQGQAALPALGPEQQETLKKLTRDLAFVKAHLYAGISQEVESDAASLLEQSRNLGHAPLLAQALLVQGNLLADLGDFETALERMDETWRTAVGGQQDRIAAEALIDMGLILSRRLGRFEEGLQRLNEAEVLIQRLPPDDAQRLEGLLWSSYGSVHASLSQDAKAEDYLNRALKATAAESVRKTSVDSPRRTLAYLQMRQGRYSEARTNLESALEHWRETLGASHPGIASLLGAMGAVTFLQNESDVSYEFFREAVEVTERALGPNHPDLISPYNGVGATQMAVGRYSLARTALEEALRLCELNYGMENPETAEVLSNLGLVHLNVGELDDAERYLGQGLRLREEILGPNHPDVARSLERWGLLMSLRGRHAEALEIHRRGLDRIREARTAPHPDIAEAQFGYGVALRRAGRFAEAETELKAVLESRLEILDPADPRIVGTLGELGLAYLEQARPAQAIQVFVRAEEFDGFTNTPPVVRAEILFGHAQALMQLEKDQFRAFALARRALVELRSSEASVFLSADEVNRWIQKYSRL